MEPNNQIDEELPQNPFSRPLHFETFPFDELVSQIKSERPQVVLRLCHGFWERILAFHDFFFPNGHLRKYRKEDTELYEAHPANISGFLHQGHALMLIEQITNLSPDNNLLFCASDLGWQFGQEIEGTPLKPLKVHQLISRLVPKEIKIYDGLWPKIHINDGKIRQLFQILKDREVIIVGPARCESFPLKLGIKKYIFVETHPSQARKVFKELELKLSQALKYSSSENPIVLFEAGNLAVYLPLSLMNTFPSATFLDVGQLLDLFNIDYILKRNFALFNRKEILALYDSIPAVSKKGKIHLYEYPRPLLDKKIAGKVPFVENKPVKRTLIEKYLRESRNINMWANDGPVLKRLETELNLIIDHGGLDAIATTSCTTGIQLCAQAAMYTAGKELKWIASSFGFFSSQLNELRHARLIDSDERGFLSLSELRALSTDNYDGIVVTNIFGLRRNNINQYIDFANKHDKYLIIDNAAGLTALERSVYSDNIFEAVSFHHTKAYGFGEGGVVICNDSNAEVIKKLRNFGVNLPENHLNLGTNGKLSDVAASYILQRLESREEWTFLYRMQARRINNIAKTAGLQPVGSEAERLDIVGSLPFTTNQSITQEQLDNRYFALRKYYRPLTDTKNASALYEKIINIPCHPDMANIDSKIIYDTLRSFRA